MILRSLQTSHSPFPTNKSFCVPPKHILLGSLQTDPFACCVRACMCVFVCVYALVHVDDVVFFNLGVDMTVFVGVWALFWL